MARYFSNFCWFYLQSTLLNRQPHWFDLISLVSQDSRFLALIKTKNPSKSSSLTRFPLNNLVLFRRLINQNLQETSDNKERKKEKLMIKSRRNAFRPPSWDFPCPFFLPYGPLFSPFLSKISLIKGQNPSSSLEIPFLPHFFLSYPFISPPYEAFYTFSPPFLGFCSFLKKLIQN